MKLAQCVLSVWLLGSSVPAFADSLTDLLPAETKVVFGIRLHNIAFSPVVTGLSSQAKSMAGDWVKLLASNDFQFLRDIDEVLIATAGEGKDAPTLLIAGGRFDLARLAEHAREYRNVPLLGGEKDGEGMIALLSPELAIAGNQAMVRAAIDHRGGAPKVDGALNDRITSLRQRYDVWGVGDHLGSLAAQLGDVKGLDSIDRFQFGIQLASGLELSGELHASNTKEGQELTQALQMMATMLKSEPSSSGVKFDVQVNDGTMKFAASIADADLKRMMTGITAPPPPSDAAPASAPELALASKPDPAPAEAPEPVVQPAPAIPEPAPAAAMEPVKEAPKPAPKAPAAIFDKEGNTVVFTLPGKK